VATKRQQTMAKITRERAVKEKRERKLEKKRAARLQAAHAKTPDVVEEDATREGGAVQQAVDNG